MHNASPPRIAGQKRAAEASPKLTPDNHPLVDTGNNMVMEECDEELVPARLEDKFAQHPGCSATKPWLDPEAYSALLREPDPPQPGDWLPYDFDEGDEYTASNMREINGLKLEEELRSRVQKCKQQERSQSHPKWGPFRLAASTSQPSEFEVINSKGNKVLSLRRADYSLHTGEVEFDVGDSLTYTILCYAGPKLVLDQISPAISSKLAPGPFRLQRDVNHPRQINVSSCGNIVHSFDLSQTPRPSDEDNLPPGQQGSLNLKRRLNFGAIRSQSYDVNSTANELLGRPRILLAKQLEIIFY
jgi:hypothetical protein